MAERAVRKPERSRVSAALAPAERLDQLLQSVAELARSGPAEALIEVLREADRLIAREGERLERDASAAPQLRAMQRRILEESRALESEQHRIVRDLAALQAAAQLEGRYAPHRPAAIALDRRG